MLKRKIAKDKFATAKFVKINDVEEELLKKINSDEFFVIESLLFLEIVIEEVIEEIKTKFQGM